MQYAYKVFTINPTATKIRTSDEELQRALKTRAANESKARARTRKFLKNIRVFILGKSLPYVKPDLTPRDLFFIVLYLQINIRFVVNYIDLSMQWGGFLVWTVFSLMNILICTGLAFLYTFFGDYGSRSFLSVWDMNPFFQGISVCMFMWEVLKLMETGLIISSGLLSIKLYFKMKAEGNPVPVVPMNCTATRFVFQPAWAIPYGISGDFTAFGFNPESNNYSHWAYDSSRGWYMGLVWFTVIFIRLFQYKRTRIFPIRVVPILFIIVIILITAVAMILNEHSASAVVYSNAYGDVFAYLQIFAFSINDYLPSHWVTVGYLHPNMSRTSLIWAISFVKIFSGFLIYFAVPDFAAYFRGYAHVTNDNCLNFFGIHFLFVVVPIAISRFSMKYLDYLLYAVYMLLTFMHGCCYLLLNVEMLSMALNLKSVLFNRFRNLIFVLSALLLYCAAQVLSVNTLHYVLYYMNFRSHYYTAGIVLILTMLGIAIYGIERINADHHFLFGTAYQHLNSTKLLVVVCTCLSAVYILDTALFHVDRDPIHNIYWIILGVCLLPFMFGIFNTLGHRKAYHGFFHPLTTWGRPQYLVRVGRRRKDLRYMFIYRTKRECKHSCLLNHPTLMTDVQDEIALREELLGEVLNLHGLLLDDPYSDEEDNPTQSKPSNPEASEVSEVMDVVELT